MKSSTKKKISIFPGLHLPGEPVCHDAAIQECAYLSSQLILRSELQEMRRERQLLLHEFN